MQRIFIRKRYHLAKWYHRFYFLLCLLVSWHQISYFSLINWFFFCSFTWFSGYKCIILFLKLEVLQRGPISALRVTLQLHLGFLTLLCVLLLRFLYITYSIDGYQEDDWKNYFELEYDFHFTKTFFGQKTLFPIFLELLVYCLMLISMLIVTLLNLQIPEKEGLIIEQSPMYANIEENRQTFAARSHQPSPDQPLDHFDGVQGDNLLDDEDEFTLYQQKIAYERQQTLNGLNMICILLLSLLNEGLLTFLLMVGLLTYLAIYFHALDNVDRFKISKYLNMIISIISFVFLYLFLLPSLSYVQAFYNTEILVLTGTVALYTVLKLFSITLILSLLFTSVRVLHYQQIVDFSNLDLIDKEIQKESIRKREERGEISGIGLYLSQNYFGVIVILSIFWISKQYSILRGLVFLLIIFGLVKRYRFKARKIWQTSIVILYVACIQFLLLLFYNIPFIISHNYYVIIFEFIGMYEIQNYEPDEQYAIFKFFWRRGSQVFEELVYILFLAWLIHSQQTLDQKRYQKMIDELVHQKKINRKEEKGGWVKFKSLMEKFFYECKRSILIHFDKVIIYLTLIFQIVIYFCFLVSLRQPDIFRASFLLFFIMYAFVDLNDRKRYMRNQITVTLIILFVLYTSQLIFMHNLEQLNDYGITIGMEDLGSVHQTPFYFVYQFYDIICGLLLLYFQVRIIYKTEPLIKYKKQLKEISQFDEQEEELIPLTNQDEAKQRQMIKVYLMLDTIKKIFVVYGLFICQIILLVVAFIPPANLLSLVFILFFQGFLYLNYQYNEQRQIVQRLIQYWGFLMGICIFILVVRYIYTIEMIYYIAQFIVEEQTELGDFGLNPDYNTVKLLGFALVLLLLGSYRRFYHSKIYDLLSLHYERVAQQERKRLLDHRTYSYDFYTIKVRLCVLGIFHLQKFIFIFAFYIAIYQQSYIGILFICMIFVILFNERNNNWTIISVPFLVVLFIQILIQFICQSNTLQTYLEGQEMFQWIGIYDQYENKYWVLMILLHSCELLPLLYSLCKFQVQPIFDRYFINPEEREILHLNLWNELLLNIYPAYHIVYKKWDNLPVDESSESEEENENDVMRQTYRASLSGDSKETQKQQEAQIAEKEIQQILDTSSTKEERFKLLTTYYTNQPKIIQYREYLQTLPIYKCLLFHQDLDDFFTLIGLEVCLFLMVITAYYQRNFFSVFYIVVASIFANFSQMLSRDSKKSLNLFRVVWSSLCILMMFEVIRKYSILQWTPQSWDIRKPWWYFGYTCDERGKESFNQTDPEDNISDFMKCQSDWNYWLSLNGYSHFDIWITFFSLLMAICFLRHFKTIERQQNEYREKEERSVIVQSGIQYQIKPPSAIYSERNSVSSIGESQDPKDFTYAQNRKTASDFIKFYVFCYFYKLALIIFLLIGVSSDISSYTDLISCLYFFLAINLLYLSDKLQTKKDIIWSKLVFFNTIVMILMSLYQAPFVKCPIIYEDDRYYYDNTDCVQLQQTNHYYNSDFFIFLQDEFSSLSKENQLDQRYAGVSSRDVFYMFASHILGLNKTLNFYFGFSQETLMALFFFMGLLQKTIWSHYYTTKYVDPYFQRQQDKQKISAIQLVEGIHLRRIWNFKYNQAQKECHDSMQARVSTRVKKWDEFFQFDQDYKKKNFFYSLQIEQEVNRRSKFNQEGRVQMIRFEEGISPGEEEKQQRGLHSSFDSNDFETLQKDDENKIVQAEQIVQNNRAPIIQLYDACQIVKLAQDDPEMLSILLQQFKLLEERSLLEQIYTNENIGMFKYYAHNMEAIDLELLKIQEQKEQFLKLKQLEFEVEVSSEKIQAENRDIVKEFAKPNDQAKEYVKEQAKRPMQGQTEGQQQQISEFHQDGDDSMFDLGAGSDSEASQVQGVVAGQQFQPLLETSQQLNISQSLITQRRNHGESGNPRDVQSQRQQVQRQEPLSQSRQDQSEEHKSQIRDILSESDSSVPDVPEEEINQEQIPSQAKDDQQVLATQEHPPHHKRKKHSSLTNMWLGFKLSLKEFIIDVLHNNAYLRDSRMRKQEIDQKKLGVLIFYFIANYFAMICVIMMIINTCYNANLLAILMPLSAFLYGMVENPLPNKKYWNLLLLYIMITISLKFIYQMPIFCDSPPYTLIGFTDSENCEPRIATITEKITRLDYIIGIRKYNSSEGETFLKNVWIDIVLFVFFLIQRFLLQTQGIWDHIRQSKDLYYIPQFIEKKSQRTKVVKNEVEKEIVQQEEDEDDFNEKSKLLKEKPLRDSEIIKKGSLPGQISSYNQQTQASLVNFFYRVFPTFLSIVYLHSFWTRTKQHTQTPAQNDGILNQEEEEKQQQQDRNQSHQVVHSQNYLDDVDDSDARRRIRTISHVNDPPISNNMEPELAQWKLEKKEAVIFPEQIKTGKDIYGPGFVICLIILIYFLVFFPKIISKRSYAHISQGKSSRFSSEVIFVLLLVITIIIIDRMLFIIRKVTKNPNDMQALILQQEQTQKEDFSKYTLLVKAIMHVLLIIVVHYYFFFEIPRKTNRSKKFQFQSYFKGFQESGYLIMAYLLICFYFLVSAVQIRYGYPVSEVSQVFTGSNDSFNSTAFAIYRAIPFLYELRIIIDWTFTSTSLDLIQWFKLEDIYATLYTCQYYMKDRIKNHRLGHQRKTSEKCCSGFCFALFLIFILILPILIFSSLNPAVELNNIISGNYYLLSYFIIGKFVIKTSFIGAEDKLYFTLFQINNIELLDIPADQFKKIQKVYGEIESSWQERMQKIRIKRFSDIEWNLPENYREQIRKMIKSQNYAVEIECEWQFAKSDKNGGTKTSQGSNQIVGHDIFVSSFGKILSPRSPDAHFDLDNLVPKFIYVGDSAQTEVLRLEPVNIRNQEDFNSFFQSIRLLHKKTGDQIFFELAPNDKSKDLHDIGANESQRLEFFVLNELAFGSIIGVLSDNVSIIGIYATFVLAVGRFLRLTYDKISMRAVYEEMPNVSELFDLCQSIYIARVDGNLKKEEIFYELLIRIYRSPEILFKMTGTSVYDLRDGR